MAKIKIISECPLYDGMPVTFKAPCDCTAVDGLTVAYGTMSQNFGFRDAHGNDLAGIGNLFAEGAYVKAIQNTVNGYAYIQNADTNKYLEDKFAGKADLQNGKVPTSQLPAMDYAASTHKHAAGDITSGTLGVARGGTGATTFTSGAALIGAGTGAVTTRSITNNTSAGTAITGSTNLVTMNTLRYALNRTTGPTAADTNYTTAMMRAIKAQTTDLTAGTTSLTNGQICLVYE